MSTSVARVAPTSPLTPVHTPQAGPQGKPTAPDRPPERAAPARPFADMLRQRRADASAPAPVPAPRPARDEAPSSPTPAEPSSNAEADASTPEKNVASARAKARSALSNKGSARPEKTATEPGVSQGRGLAAEGSDSTNDRSPSAAEGAARPVLLPDDRAVLALQRATGGAGEDAGDLDEGDRSDSGDMPGAGGSPSRPRSGRSAANDAGSARSEGSIRAEGSNPSHAESAALGAEGAAKAEAGAHRSAHDLLPLPAPPAPPATAASAPLASGEPMRTDPPAPTLTFATPVDSPQFAGALGVQVSVLARGGVQHAELHLNPAEMGPVSIRIELDGTDAQVQFGADLAETRRAIENGLPELASALRDAGFTLSGGGVSQHASQRGGADGEGDGATSHLARAADLHADSDASGTGAPRAVRHVAAGGVDVYA